MIDKSGGASEFTTVIGSDAVFKGELEFEKGVRVDGRVEGKISTKGHLAVSQAGKLQADVKASNIVVEGEVKGNLNSSDRVELRKTARLTGDIQATKLLVAEGASFTGHCAVGPNNVVCVANSRLRFYRKDGTLTAQHNLTGSTGFWGQQGAIGPNAGQAGASADAGAASTNRMAGKEALPRK